MAPPLRRRVAGSDPGVEIALLQWGEAGPLVLAHHANGFCAGTWGEVAEALAPRCRFVAMDARGHGDSSKPEDPGAYAWERFVADWVAVADQVAADAPDGRVALGIGHSFGGSALCMAAAERPQRFASLLLLDPVLFEPVSHARRMAHAPGEHPAEKSERRRSVWPSREEAVKLWAERPFFAGWTPRARELYARWGLGERADGQVELKCPPAVEAAIFRNGGSLDPLPLADRIRARTLFVHAGRGHFDPALYRAIAERMPDARVETADVDHLMLMEDPAFVVGCVQRMLDQESPEPDSTG
jgi:pimeloyl-ACP methyl ester carboxylesterase